MILRSLVLALVLILNACAGALSGGRPAEEADRIQEAAGSSAPAGGAATPVAGSTEPQVVRFLVPTIT